MAKRKYREPISDMQFMLRVVAILLVISVFVYFIFIRSPHTT